jgi:hypothetical protein
VFAQNIAFVVGAGASTEFGGLGTGAQLMEMVAADIGQFGGHSVELNSLLRRGIPAERLSSFDVAGRDLARHLKSGVPSMDDALTWFASRQEVVDLGKIAIAYEILRGERDSRLYTPGGRLAPARDFSDTWIHHFLSMVMSGHRNENAERAFDKVTIINFNYDRTIEHFVHSALQLKYGLNEQRAKKIASEIVIIRPYGSVGNLPWQHGEPTLAFGAEPQGHEIVAASSSILTYSEGFTSNMQSRIQLTLEGARVCVFLGFGFHTQNMSLLRVRSAETWRRAYATVVGMHPENKRDLSFSIARSVGCNNPETPILLDWNAHKLLSDLRPAIMAAAAS